MHVGILWDSANFLSYSVLIHVFKRLCLVTTNVSCLHLACICNPFLTVPSNGLFWWCNPFFLLPLGQLLLWLCLINGSFSEQHWVSIALDVPMPIFWLFLSHLSCLGMCQRKVGVRHVVNVREEGRCLTRSYKNLLNQNLGLVSEG